MIEEEPLGYFDGGRMFWVCALGSENMSRYQERREVELRIRKLEAELQVLEEQVSRRYQVREWLKAGATAVAFVGVLLTSWSALFQLNEVRRTRSDERFEQAVNRLAADRTGERLSGGSALIGFLSDSTTHQKDSLIALINALAIENEPVVRDSITDILAHLPDSIPEGMLNAALRTAVARNRTVGSAFRRSRGGRMIDLTLNESKPEEGRLLSLGRAITSLMRAGATDKDLADIYCFDCDFSGIKSNTLRFDRAILAHASFERAELVGSRFQQASITGGNFRSAVLRGASFSTPDPGLDDDWDMLNRWAIQGPDFSCADLSYADFSGFDLLVFEDPLLHYEGGTSQPRFRRAILQNADFRSANFLTLVTGRKGPPLPATLMSFYPVGIPGKAQVWRWRMGSDEGRPTSPGSYQSLKLKLSEIFDENWKQAKFDPSFQHLIEKAAIHSSSEACR